MDPNITAVKNVERTFGSLIGIVIKKFNDSKAFFPKTMIKELRTHLA